MTICARGVAKSLDTSPVPTHPTVHLPPLKECRWCNSGVEDQDAPHFTPCRPYTPLEEE